jgi:DNA-binding response OmpR family regulator
MHVLLTEDNALIASGIVAGLEAQGFTVAHAATAAQADALLRAARFDLMILDLGLPDEDGLHFLHRLRRRGLELPVLILTARDAVAERVSGLQAGADDYLVKPFDLRELAARLHALLRRAAGRATHLIEHGPLTYDPAACAAFMAGEPIDLSRREQALLQALLQHPGRVLSAEQLKDAVYGLGDDVESNALNVHIHHLRRKLGNGIVETVRGLGYRLGVAAAATDPMRDPDS